MNGSTHTIRHEWRSRRPAFSLIELLVVIAIIAVLIALLLPAVQQAREAARRTQCKNHLKQIGLALHNYHDVYNGFPPSIVVGRCQPHFFWGQNPPGYWSWRARLLPFIEQSALYDQIDFRDNPLDYGVLAFYRPQTSINMPVYMCPSDPKSETQWADEVFDPWGGPASVALSNYMGVQGSERLIPDADLCGMFANGSSTRPKGDGVFGDVNYSAKIRDITDGTSNTIHVGERPTEDYWGWWPVGTGNDMLGLADFVLDCSEGLHAGKQGDPAHLLHFWSNHPGGAHFLMGDGSVHFLSYSINHPTFLALGSRNGGEVVGEF
ncbi:MAG: DUF1559 domain-containing protein [Planctomycetaceae bacterium]